MAVAVNQSVSLVGAPRRPLEKDRNRRKDILATQKFSFIFLATSPTPPSLSCKARKFLEVAARGDERPEARKTLTLS